jgi:hypothetical protein
MGGPMKIFQAFFVGSIVMLILECGCNHGNPDESFASNTNPYFPLKMGNTWIYSSRWEPSDSLTIKVIGYSWQKGRWYAEVDEQFTRSGITLLRWHSFWTYGDSGRVLKYDDLNYVGKWNKSVYYDTQAKGESTWDLNSTNAMYVKMMGRFDSLSSHGTTYRDCLAYFVDGVGGERVERLARGVGMIGMGPFELVYHDLK